MQKFMFFSKFESLRNNFYMFPKWLDYVEISLNAKMAYMYILERYKLSEKNGWIDEKNNVFCYFSRESLGGIMNISLKTVTKYLKELELEGLIVNVRQGFTKPNRIYVTYPSDEYLEELIKAFENRKIKDEYDDYVEYEEKDKSLGNTMKGNIYPSPQTVGNTMKGNIYPSGEVNITLLEGEYLPPSNTNYNNTNSSNTHSFILEKEGKKEVDKKKFVEKIKNQIMYDDLIYEFDKKIVDEYLLIILDTLTSKGETIKIKNMEKSLDLVKSRFYELSFWDIAEAITRMKKNPQRIKNMTAYIRSLLYDISISTVNQNTNEANYDIKTNFKEVN